MPDMHTWIGREYRQRLATLVALILILFNIAQEHVIVININCSEENLIFKLIFSLYI